MEQQVSSRRIGSQTEVLAVAERLGYQHGVAGVTTRAVVHKAAVSRSSVGYHFRGRDGVLIALYRKLADDAAAWRRTRIEALRKAQMTFLTLPSVFAGLMTDLTTSGGPRTLLMEEIEDLAIRGTIKLSKDFE